MVISIGDPQGGVDRDQTQNSAVNDVIATLYCLSWPVLLVALIIWISAVFGKKPDEDAKE